jgi:membrane protease YdiL (CAAX protease family)
LEWRVAETNYDKVVFAKEHLLFVLAAVLLVKIPDMITNAVWSFLHVSLLTAGVAVNASEFQNASTSMSFLFSGLVGVGLAYVASGQLFEIVPVGTVNLKGILLTILTPIIYAFYSILIFSLLLPEWSAGLALGLTLSTSPRLIALVILIPIVEEVIFRGWLYQRLTDWGKSPKNIFWVSSIAWAFCHLPNALGFIQLLLLVPLGLVLCYLRKISKGIGLPVLTHALVNLIQCLLPNIAVQSFVSLLFNAT